MCGGGVGGGRGGGGGGSESGRETPAVKKEWSCVFRGPKDSRLLFAVLEAAPRRLGSGEGPGGKRTESGEEDLRGPFGVVGVGGSRFFACISSRSFWSSLTLPFVIRPLLRGLTRSAARTCRHSQGAARQRSSWCFFSVELPEPGYSSPAPMSNRPDRCARWASSF